MSDDTNHNPGEQTGEHNDRDNERQIGGNRWLDELRAEEATANPRTEFKAELRKRILQEWDGAGNTTRPQNNATEVLPSAASPVRPHPADRPDVAHPLRRLGGASPATPGRDAGSRASSPSHTNVAWARLAAAAAVVALIGGGVFVLTRRGGDDGKIVVTNSTPQPTTAPTSVTTSTPTTTSDSTSTTTSPVDTTGGVPTSTDAATTTPRSSTTTTTTTVATEAPNPPGDADPVPAPPANPSGLTMLENWPSIDPGSIDRSAENYQRYLPTKAVPDETAVQSNTVDTSYFDPIYAQTFRIEKGMLEITTKIVGMSELPGGNGQPFEPGLLPATNESLDTTSWVNRWPSARIARTPTGVVSIILENDAGWVTVTGVGLDRATVEQVAKGIVRRSQSRPGWDLPIAAQTVSDGWQYGLAEVRTLFLSDPDTPVTQLDFTDRQLGQFPFIASNASAQFVDINGAPGAVSSSNGIITVNWIETDGKVLTLLHTGPWNEAVAIARTVEPVSLATWIDRIDGIEEKSGHEVDCFYLRCWWSPDYASP